MRYIISSYELLTTLATLSLVYQPDPVVRRVQR